MQFEAHAVSRASRSNPLRCIEAERWRSRRIAEGDPHRPTGLEGCAGLGRLWRRRQSARVLVAGWSESRRRPSGNRWSGTLLRGIRSPFVADPNAFLSNGLQMTPRPGCAWRGRPSSPFGRRRKAGEAGWTRQPHPTINRRLAGLFRGLPWHAQVAQLVEHATENRSVGGSIPPLGTMRSSAGFRPSPQTCFKRLKGMYFHLYLSAAIRGQPRKVLVALLVLMRCAGRLPHQQATRKALQT